jgi:hypothetical protein
LLKSVSKISVDGDDPQRELATDRFRRNSSTIQI